MDVVEQPWANAFRRYAGWVPNIRSHLSFSMIGAAQGALTFTKPLRRDPTRVVLVLQRRQVNDFPIPTALAIRLMPDIAVNWFMEADTAPTAIPLIRSGRIELDRDRQGMLRGRVYFLPRQETVWKQETQAELLGQLAHRIRSGATCRSDDELRAIRSSARQDAVSSGAHIAIEFALMRTGECHVWYDEAVLGITVRMLDRVAEQAYYFIKDVVHSHTHHDPTSDQITPLVRYRANSSEPGHTHEIAWRRETLWSLSREVERLNREGGLTDQRRSLGIIAYAEAFQAALMGHLRDDTSPSGFALSTEVHDFDFKYLKDSVKADIEVNATRQAQRIQVALAVVATFLSTVSVVSSLVSAHNGALPKVQKGLAPGTLGFGHVDSLIELFAFNPLITGIAVTVVLLGVVSYFLLDGRAGLFNATQRVLSQFGRAVAVSVTRSVTWQLAIDLGVHFVGIVVALALTISCVAVIAGGI